MGPQLGKPSPPRDCKAEELAQATVDSRTL